MCLVHKEQQLQSENRTQETDRQSNNALFNKNNQIRGHLLLKTLQVHEQQNVLQPLHSLILSTLDKLPLL